MYAEIAVNVPMGSWTGGEGAPPAAYHYSVPSSLAPALIPGHLVRVPFGARPALGIVLSLTESAPALKPGARIRPIDDLVDPTPALTAAQIRLAYALAEDTLAPLAEVIWAMVPAELDKKAHLMVEAAPDGSSARLGPVQTALLATLREQGAMRQERLLDTVGSRPTQSLNSLVDAGIVRRWWALEEPGMRPRTTRIICLAIPPAEIPAVLPTLGKDSHEARALAWLAASNDPLPTVGAVRAATGAPPAVLRALAERGLIGLTEERVLVGLRIARAQASHFLAESAQAAPARAHALALLLASPAPQEIAHLTAEGATETALESLKADGIIERVIEEACAFLTIPPDEIPAALADLRRSGGQSRLLQQLAVHGPEMDAALLLAEADAKPADLRALETRGLVRIEERPAWRDPLAGKSFVLTAPPTLTEDQARAWASIEAAMRGENTARPFLLHGVTGSGKTEIYLQAVAEALRRGQQALILVPEISLTPQTVRRFAARFPGRVAVWHSNLTPGQRYDTWQRVRAGEVEVVIGSRSALFAPLPRVGVVVVDEEHDASYKQDNVPRYHARDAALRLGVIAGVVVILGSATPDVQTFARAERGEIGLLRLPRRVLGHRQAVAEHTARLGLSDTGAMHPLSGDTLYADLPPVEVVDLRTELRAGNTGIFSRSLRSALKETLERRQQAILFLNRRGAASFVMCRDCGYVVACARCSSPLTFHAVGSLLACHHCGHRQPPPSVCPQCHSERIKHFGVGTQRIEETIHAQFPEARVIRWDRDTTRGRTAHGDYLDAFVRGEADVLVGTQMIAKGLDLPLVTLVGVVSADVGLHLPDFRAAERTFQILTQVAGRAARGPLGGRVIIQTYTPEHYAIQAAARHDYDTFYETEMTFRQVADYPPFTRLARLLYTDPTWERARGEAESMGARLTQYIRRQGIANTSLIGPAPAYFGRERGEFRWHILLRSAEPASILRGFFAADRLPYGWRIDMDPVTLL
ncbi:MAG: primosomal protein N' [Anaerolineae bacterium]